MAEENKVEQLRQLVDADPGNPYTRFNLGREYLRMRDYAAAAEEFRRAADLEPEFAAAYRERGMALEQLKLPDRARVTYQRGLEVARRNNELGLAREMEDALERLGPA